MAIAEAGGTPIAIHVASASSHETTLVAPTLAARFTEEAPTRLVGDRAYDSDRLDAELIRQGIERIAPHRRNPKKSKRQDGRKLRRYRRRWKVERLFAWLQNFRRIAMRHDRHDESYLGFVLLGCLVIFLRTFFG